MNRSEIDAGLPAQRRSAVGSPFIWIEEIQPNGRQSTTAEAVPLLLKGGFCPTEEKAPLCKGGSARRAVGDCTGRPGITIPPSPAVPPPFTQGRLGKGACGAPRFRQTPVGTAIPTGHRLAVRGPMWSSAPTPVRRKHPHTDRQGCRSLRCLLRSDEWVQNRLSFFQK